MGIVARLLQRRMFRNCVTMLFLCAAIIEASGRSVADVDSYSWLPGEVKIGPGDSKIDTDHVDIAWLRFSAGATTYLTMKATVTNNYSTRRIVNARCRLYAKDNSFLGKSETVSPTDLSSGETQQRSQITMNSLDSGTTPDHATCRFFSESWDEYNS